MGFVAWYGKVSYENGGAPSLWIGTLGFGLFGTPSLSRRWLSITHLSNQDWEKGARRRHQAVGPA